MSDDRPRSSFRAERLLVNRQRQVAVRSRPLADFLARACRLVLPPAAGVAVCLVSDPEMARLNRTYRSKSGPTDVLSFTSDRDVAARRRATRKTGFHLGDIAISPSAARRNARRYGRAVEEELRVLILHGILHLAGYDHENDHGEMERYELRLRRRLGIV
jgi:probable rRNA maturation factor